MRPKLILTDLDGTLLREDKTLSPINRAALEQALAYAGGNRALAARVLGISRTALYQKLERFHLS